MSKSEKKHVYVYCWQTWGSVETVPPQIGLMGKRQGEKYYWVRPVQVKTFRGFKLGRVTQR